MKLLVFNYSMNETSQVFSHQSLIVTKLSQYFDSIDVVTSETFTSSAPSNVNVSSVGWVPGRGVRNIFKFYRRTLPLLMKHRNGKVFSHMTEVQSFLISPFCKILKIDHFLWYAHKSSSLFLTLSYPFLNGILTSTSGSCPIQGSKVKILGQSIDLDLANHISRSATLPPLSWYHIGRLDPSKNLEMIIEALSFYAERDSRITLHLYGIPSSANYDKYFRDLKSKYKCYLNSWLYFHGQLSHAELATVSSCHDGFIHAFWGSLDKALLEAIILKRAVVSANPEFLNEFRKKDLIQENQFHELSIQLQDMYETTDHLLKEQIELDYEVLCRNHGIENWINQLVSILMEG